MIHGLVGKRMKQVTIEELIEDEIPRKVKHGLT
jgi:hypothetical protein